MRQKESLERYSDLFSVLQQFQQADATSEPNASFLLVHALQLQYGGVQLRATMYGLQDAIHMI